MYKIATENEYGETLYFNRDFAFFGAKFGTEYKTRKGAEDALLYARKCAPNKCILLNLHIEKA